MTIASIDIGTNTVLLLIAKVEKKSGEITPLVNEHRMPRLGKGLIPGNNIAPDRIEKLYEILNDYQGIIRNAYAEKVIITATNAFRIAANAGEIIVEIKKKFDLDVNIIDGKTEAKFAFLGAIPSSLKYKSGLVIDIGGGSTELIFGKNKEYSFLKSYPIGSVSATEKHLKSNPPSQSEINSLNGNLETIFEEIKGFPAPEVSIAISGTPTTIICMLKDLKEYNDSVVEGSQLNFDDLSKLIQKISKLSSIQIKESYGNVMRGREDIILAGAYILLNIMKLLNLPDVIVSSRGIRYGAIVNYMNQSK